MLPGWGGMAVLDRAWYGRVLVERVEGFASEEQWQRAYAEIVDFETHAGRRGHDPGQVLDAHLRRGAAAPLRVPPGRPAQAWKLTDEDWRNREKRPAYEAAVEEMLERTDHPAGRWHVVAAENKRWARVDVVRTVCEEIEKALAARGIDADPPLSRSGHR